MSSIAAARKILDAREKRTTPPDLPPPPDEIDAPDWGSGPPTPPQSLKRIKLIDDEELEGVVAPPAAVEGVLFGNGFGQLFGAPGTLKSFVALDLMCSMAIGLDWHGRKVEQAPGIYILSEGAYGMRNRVLAWKKYNGVTGKLGIYFLRTSISLTRVNRDVTELIAEIEERVSPSPGLIVVDTLSRNIVGSERNDEDMNAYIGGCDRLREATGAHVLSIHHSGYVESERGRGASNLPAALDTDIQCVRDGDRVTLSCKKQKDAAPFPDMVFEAIPAAGSLVLKAVDQLGGKLDGNRLLCLQAVHRYDGGLTHAQWLKESGLEHKRSSFNAALEWLRQSAYVKHTIDKKYVPTDAGRLALSPQSNGSPALVQMAPVISGPSQGGMYIPPDGLNPMDEQEDLSL